MTTSLLKPGAAALVLSAGALLAAATAAFAQDGLVANGRMLSAVADFGRDLGPAPAIANGPNIGGSRYTIVGGRLVDRRTGSGVDLPEQGQLVGIDPVRPRVFVRAPGSAVAIISAVDAATGAVRPFTFVGPTEAAHANSVQVAWSANRVYVDVAETLFTPPDRVIAHRVRAFDGLTGAAASGEFSFQGPPGAPWLVTPEGDRAYVAEGHGLAVIDLASGRRRLVPLPATGFVWDDLNERLLTSLGDALAVLSRDGTYLGQAPMPGCFSIAASPHTRRLYVRRYQQSTYGSLNEVRVYDSRSYALLGETHLPYLNGCALNLLAAPGPPRQVAAAVTGRDVALSWVNVGAASHFVVDVGLAPGRTDVSFWLGADTRARFTAVPAGTYYLRLRGGNEIGGGGVSNEIRVVVP